MDYRQRYAVVAMLPQGVLRRSSGEVTSGVPVDPVTVSGYRYAGMLSTAFSSGARDASCSWFMPRRWVLGG